VPEKPMSDNPSIISVPMGILMLNYRGAFSHIDQSMVILEFSESLELQYLEYWYCNGLSFILVFGCMRLYVFAILGSLEEFQLFLKLVHPNYLKKVQSM
jgi:hypothetical protein